MSSSIVLLFITSYQLFFSLCVISLDPHEEMNCCCAPESIGPTELEGGNGTLQKTTSRCQELMMIFTFLKPEHPSLLTVL